MVSNDRVIDSHSHTKTYVLTTDLGARFEQYRRVGLKTPEPDDPLFTDIQRQLEVELGEALSTAELHSVRMVDLADEILAQARDRLGRDTVKQATIVSTCLEIAAPSGGKTIEINRLIDASGKIIGRGPRPGHPSIKSQVQAIANEAKGGTIIIVEDGTFTGSTLVDVLEQFRSLPRGPKVEAIVLGFAFPEAKKRLAEAFDGQLVVVEDTDEDGLVDWMPDHDFFPFASNCGRVLGTMVGEVSYPFYCGAGLTYACPYVQPFGDPVGWASLPSRTARDISAFCLKGTKAIIEHLERMNNGELTISDLTGGWERVSVPYRLGQTDFPRIGEVRAWEIIRDAINEIS